MCMAGGAAADDREVGERVVEAGGVEHGGADALQRIALERDVPVAGVAQRQGAVPAAEDVAPWPVAEVDVLDEAEALEGLEVAVDRRQVRWGQLPVEAGGDGVGGHRRIGGVERFEHEAPGGRYAQAAGAQGADGSTRCRGRERSRERRDGHEWGPPSAPPLPGNAVSR